MLFTYYIFLSPLEIFRSKYLEQPFKAFECAFKVL